MYSPLVIYTFLLALSLVKANQMNYKVGVGRADCTGPVGGITFMGFAKVTEMGCGLHLRQFARAFIFDDGAKRVVFVSVDGHSISHPLREAILDKLKIKYGDMYSVDNLVLSATHTHGVPGGFAKDLIYDISVLGFIPETFNALVNGIVRAIKRAHNNMVGARLYLSSGIVLNSNVNRSPAAYSYNPKEEQNMYEHDVDKQLVQLKITKKTTGDLIGAINWFAVHPTSMNSSNCLVTSDNMGYASILLESSVDPAYLTGQGPFVGAFASSNLGDVSPNIKGPICIDTGLPCDYTHSTCNGMNQLCIASGPGEDIFESTEIIATNMFLTARELLDYNNVTEITGDIRFVHRFFDMPEEKATIHIEDNITKEVRGCLPAMGYAFAAGTTDGPGEFDFAQGNKNSSNKFWNRFRDFVSPPSDDDKDCHFPKPILLMTGKIEKPYEWQPRVVPTQLLKIGQLIVAAIPAELTTMSGRRLRNAVREKITLTGGSTDTQVVIAGLSNMYTSYVATPEEYQLQRYEGASTIFGPHTLTLYLKIYQELADGLMKGKKVRENETEPGPYQFPYKMMNLVSPVLYDSTGSLIRRFGDCITEPEKTYYHIGDIVSATFVAGHPRNNLLQEETFLTVERIEPSFHSSWKIVATDASWETRFLWRRQLLIGGTSHAEIQWKIPESVIPGTYIIRHFGTYKYIFGGTYAYSGTSRIFYVRKGERTKDD